MWGMREHGTVRSAVVGCRNMHGDSAAWMPQAPAPAGAGRYAAAPCNAVGRDPKAPAAVSNV